MTAHHLHRPQDHHQHYLGSGDEVTGRPEEGDEDGQLHIGFRIDIILHPELLPLHAFPAEGPDHPHSGEVLLGDGGEIAFLLVRHQERLADLAEEHHGIQKDHRHKDGGQHRQLRIQPEHEIQGQDDQQDDAEHTGQLFRQEFLHRLHIGGAALDQVTGAVLSVPGEADPLQMGK